MDEKMKHRLIGAAVLVALVTLILPVIVNKPGHELRTTRVVANTIPRPPVQLKATPAQPHRVIFQTEGVVRKERQVESDKIALQTAARASLHANLKKQQELLKPRTPVAVSLPTPAKPTPQIALATVHKVNAKPRPIKSKQHAVAHKTHPKKIIHRQAVKRVKRRDWSIQLASFAELRHARILRQRLRDIGYKVYLRKIVSHRGVRLTQVFVGPEHRRSQAEKLRRKLKRTLKLNGIVVHYSQPTGHHA